ncbi:MAG TPA: rhomboid family intramembrane serine protease [Pontiellaceae bacterium]|nr:rhomboid family intramembrane serine protease [Pontiellaceae bacterium]HPR82587.1 rhomboid family intramembrane serine protease [Pontiellaceae bacterium]
MRTATQDISGNPTEMTFGVQMLLIINIAAYVIEYIFHFPLSAFGALRANWWEHLAIWQLITYQFIHRGFWHIFWNMLGLYFLGPETERTLGTNRFFALYFLSGVLGGLGWSLLSPDYAVCVGASAAVFGVLGAYAALYPNRELILIFLPFVPIKAWLFVLLLGAYEFMHTLAGPGGGIANSAHLGGAIAGYVYATVAERTDLLWKVKEKFKAKAKPPVSRAEIDRILDKAAQQGMHSLTSRERDLLKRAGKQ